MELPISPQSYHPPVAALVRAVKRARLMLGRMLGQETNLDGATAISNDARGMVRLANFATEVHQPAEVAAGTVLEEIRRHFQEAGSPCHTLDSAEELWPENFSSLLPALGYRAKTRLVYLLSKYIQPRDPRPSLQIIPARAAYRQLPDFYRGMARQEWAADDTLADQIASAMMDRLDEPRLELFLGRLDGRVAGAAGVVTLGQSGVIDPAYVDPAYRGRGAARDLMHYLIDHCRRAQFEQVLLERSEGCPSIGFYESLGFRRAASFLRFVLDV